MAENSIREQLILSNESLLTSLGIFNGIKRVRLSHSDLSEFAHPQFPVLAIVGGLPQPDPHEVSRGVPKDIFQMKLVIQLFVYIHERNDFDTMISSIMDDMWRILHTDQTRGNLTYETIIKPAKDVYAYAPYAGFQMLIEHKYQTGIGGI